ncbi:hypothetical protein D5F11_022995 [Siminovitchia terrae]|uniref:Uncharacterized protein n=1 Tax=Siminovitchia terrae TaxID=1914933 RepID=A0A429X1L3_SIMTE|nr:hypothetical protein [Siminovitchia terrae]RST57379.1 hypothetical protein D5F11_022995 [Siminovitchia terrae]
MKMNKKKINFRAFGIALIAGCTLVISGCAGSSGGEQPAPKKENQVKKQEKEPKDELQRDKEMRAEMNEKFKDADKVIHQFIVAYFEGDLDILESIFLSGGAGDEKQKGNGRQSLEAQNNGPFDENVDEYYFVRYSSEYDEFEKLYYQTYVYKHGAMAAVSTNVALVKDESGQWKVENYGLSSSEVFPQGIEKHGGTVSTLYFDGEGNLTKND